MKLLILTQKVDIDDDVLGFMHGWIREFAKHCEQVTVICLSKGKYDLPDNVRVMSLGKELKANRFIYLINFYKYIWRERTNYDAVLVHMNPIYAVLGGLFWRSGKKKIGLWYTHKDVDLKLRLAEKIVDVVFTASPESFRLPSKKVNVLGHGIDIEKFTPLNNFFERKISAKAEFDGAKIITVGRISPVKDYETLINAAELLKKENIKFRLAIIGGPATKNDEKYYNELKNLVAIRGLASIINFLGPVPNKNIEKYLQTADLFINLSQTGSLDKAVLEAMACGLPVLTCNEAFLKILRDYKDSLIFQRKDAGELVKRIKNILKMGRAEKNELGKSLRGIIVKNHSLAGLIEKILSLYK